MENKRRSVAVVAILAVAAVAVIGAGFAAYWGQTEIADNDITSKYISVATDDGRINANIEYDTLYSKSIKTADPLTYDDYSSYKIIPSDYKDKAGEVGFETGVSTATKYNLIPLYTADSGDYKVVKEYVFTLTSDVAKAKGSYDFQVKLSGIDTNIGSGVTLYFAYETYDTESGAGTAALSPSTVLYPFYPTDVAGTYVCVVKDAAPAVTTPTESPEAGFTDTYFGYIFADIKGIQEEVSDKHYCKLTNGTAAPNVTPNSARLNVTDGVLQFQGMIDGVVMTKELPATGNITLTTADGFAISKCISADTSVATVTDAGIVTVTGGSGSSTVIVVKLVHGDDVFYRLVDISVA